jgi:hypothetical protein
LTLPSPPDLASWIGPETDDDLPPQQGRWGVRHKVQDPRGRRPQALRCLAHVQPDRRHEASSVTASLVWDAKGNDPDLTKYPWALHSVWRLPQPQTLAVILEWQPASALPTLAVGNMTPMTSSGTVMFTPLRSSSVAEVDETASIMYIVPYVDYT